MPLSQSSRLTILRAIYRGRSELLSRTAIITFTPSPWHAKVGFGTSAAAFAIFVRVATATTVLILGLIDRARAKHHQTSIAVVLGGAEGIALAPSVVGARTETGAFVAALAPVGSSGIL